jgi:hypothetical protein
VQALDQEGMALYLTRRNSRAASWLWHEMLRLLLASARTPSSPQLYFLSDLTTVALVQQWPEDRVRSIKLKRAVSVGCAKAPALCC